MRRFDCALSLLLTNISVTSAFAPESVVHLGAAHDAMTSIPSGATASIDTELNSLVSGVGSALLSLANDSETVIRQPLINWEHPAQAIGASVTLLYIVFSVLAGIKYIVKDGWRPKF